VSSNSHDRDLRLARVAYMGAVQRLNAAFDELAACDMPLDPGTGADPRPWTAGQVAVMREVAAAIAAVLDRRRAWDRMRREWTPPH
jgi:hypothetical protein